MRYSPLVFLECRTCLIIIQSYKFNSLCQMQAHRCLVIIQSFNLLLSLTNAGLKGGHLHDPQHISDKVQIIYFSCIIR
jgi:hypothetical protein